MATMANGGDDIRLGTAVIFLTREWKLSAADAWIVLNPHSRATNRNSAGAQGRRLKRCSLKQDPPYGPRQGDALAKELPELFVLVALHRLRQHDYYYTRDHRRLHRALNLILLGKLHGMTRAKAWRALNPRSQASSDESAAALTRREVAWYRELHDRALDPPVRRTPQVEGLPPFLAAMITAEPAVEPVEAWYARLLKEQAHREEKREAGAA